MITREEILMGREKIAPLTPELEANLDDSLIKFNKVRKAYNKAMSISSGYRPPEINGATAGAAKNSTHMLCMAIDVRDPNGDFRRWVLQNLKLLKEIGIWVEDFRWTPTWVHLQTRKASRRIYLAYDPAKTPMTAPNNWDGKYDKAFD